MNLVSAIKELKKELNRILNERDSQVKNLNFSFETLSKYCTIFKNEDKNYPYLKYPINDEIHIFITDNKIFESTSAVNVIPGLKIIKEQIEQIYKKYDLEIKSLEHGIYELQQMNDVCECCEGKKEIKKRVCAEDEGEMVPCPICKGTGKSK